MAAQVIEGIFIGNLKELALEQSGDKSPALALVGTTGPLLLINAPENLVISDRWLSRGA